MELLTIQYEPETSGLKTVGDGEAQQYVEKIVLSAANGLHIILLTSQQIVVDYVRLCIYKNLIPHKEVVFKFKDFDIISDKFGRLDYWPRGFCDYQDNILNELLSDFLSPSKE